MSGGEAYFVYHFLIDTDGETVILLSAAISLLYLMIYFS